MPTHNNSQKRDVYSMLGRTTSTVTEEVELMIELAHDVGDVGAMKVAAEIHEKLQVLTVHLRSVVIE